MLTNSYDLGIFEQTVRSYANGNLPIVELKGHNYPELGDHFSPILATLAPLYKVWPSPLVLLVAQAGLFALSIIPLTCWAYRVLGAVPALTIGASYGASWGLASAVGFDFHEIAFAVPLLSCSLCALGQGKFRTSALWSLPLLLVKEDLGVTTAAIGGLIIWKGNRRWGLAALVSGFIASVLEIFFIIPATSPSGRYAYLSNFPAENSGPVQSIYQTVESFLDAPETKLITLTLLLAPCAFLALGSSLALVAVPTLTWRFASDNPLYWGHGYQYSAALMPIVFAAMIDVLCRRTARNRIRGLTLLIMLGVTAAIFPHFPMRQLFQQQFWRTPSRVEVAHQIFRLIPDGDSVSASNKLAPQLTSRTTVTLFGFGDTRISTRWIIIDVAQRSWPVNSGQRNQLIRDARNRGYETVVSQDGFLLLRRAGNS
ncbi:DUF2079 domain-containing protein [Streptomyces sp. 1222.5]